MKTLWVEYAFLLIMSVTFGCKQPVNQLKAAANANMDSSGTILPIPEPAICQHIW